MLPSVLALAALLLAVLPLSQNVQAAVNTPIMGCGSCPNLACCTVYDGCIFQSSVCLLLNTTVPTIRPTSTPSTSPTHAPTSAQPTLRPSSGAPTRKPSRPSTLRPSKKPTKFPSTKAPVPKPATKTPTTGAPTLFCLRPIKGCGSMKQQKTCKPFTGCYWKTAKGCLLKVCVEPPEATTEPSSAPTGLPTVQPTVEPHQVAVTTWSPSSSPSTGENATLSPSTEEEEGEVTESPQVSEEDPVPTSQPTPQTTRSPAVSRSPSPPPTRIPAPVVCAYPVGGCAAMTSVATCLANTGCLWSASKCSRVTACIGKDFVCGAESLALDVSGNLLPGCVRANEQECDAQRQRVFEGIGLRDCGETTVVPVASGGATLNRAVREEELAYDEEQAFYAVVDLFVHPTLGVDAPENAGNTPESPLASLAYAVQRSREEEGGRMRRKRITLMGNNTIHHLSETIYLGNQDRFLTIRGEEGATLSGAVLLPSTQSWQPVASGNVVSGEVLVTNIPSAIASKLGHLSQLSVDGQPAIRARAPNLQSFLDSKFYAATKASKWKAKVFDAPVVNRTNLVLEANYSDFNAFSQATGGGCEGVFNPPTGFFCEPKHQAQGGCPHAVPAGVSIDGAIASQLKFSSWVLPDVYFHTFQPQKWGLWTFRLSVAPTGAPSTVPTTKPSKSPSSKPTRTPSAEPTTLSPTAPTQQPTTGPSKSPSFRPTRTPTKFPVSKSPTSAPSPKGATMRPSCVPSESPSSAPSTSPTDDDEEERLRRVLSASAASKFTRRDLQPAPVPIFFQEGGWQEARGDCGSGGGEWFVENALALLDAPNEFFLEFLPDGSVDLYFFPNGTHPANAARVELSTLNNLIVIRGDSKDHPATDIEIRNVRMEQTYPTHMFPFEIPSGGDWAVHRSGAIFLEFAERITVYGNKFWNLGGNGVFVSRNARDVVIQRNDFDVLGSSAVMLVGDPLFDSPTPWDRRFDNDFVERVWVTENIMSNVGVAVKQSAGVFVAIGKSIRVEDNVVFNSPRAGLVMNDGFGGNTSFTGNLVFNTVTETEDHGPFNVWDRQRWIQPENSNPKVQPFVFANNFLFGSENGYKGIDLDDGVTYYNIVNNVVINGLQKFKGNDVTVTSNFIFPSQWGCVAITPSNMGLLTIQPARLVFSQNTCVMPSNLPPYYNNMGTATNEPKLLCQPRNFKSSGNQYFGSRVDGTWSNCGVSLNWATWIGTTYRQDVGSLKQALIPATSLLIAQIVSMLPMFAKYN